MRIKLYYIINSRKYFIVATKTTTLFIGLMIIVFRCIPTQTSIEKISFFSRDKIRYFETNVKEVRYLLDVNQ